MLSEQGVAMFSTSLFSFHCSVKMNVAIGGASMALAARPDSFNVSFFDENLARKNFDHYTDYVLGYGRLSFDEDGEGYCSIVNKRDILAEFYERKLKNASSVYDFVADDNVSGDKFDRQGLFDVLNRIENGK